MASILFAGCLVGCNQTTPTEPVDSSEQQSQPVEGENLVANGDFEVFRTLISADEEVAVRQLGQTWATDYGLGTYTGNGENVAKVTKIDGDPCIKLDGRGGSSNIWIWAGGSSADTYMYHPLGASPAGEYRIEVDLFYDVTGIAAPTMDALATEFLGGPAQSMIQFTEYAEFEALPASTVRGAGWKHGSFLLNKMADADGNGWFNLYVIPGDQGGVLYADNIQVIYNETGYDYSFLVDVNDGDKGMFSSYYQRMFTNDYAENNGYYTIGSEDAKGKVVIDGTVCAARLSYEGHGENASFAKNVNLTTARNKTVTVEFDAKTNAVAADIAFNLAGAEGVGTTAQQIDFAAGTQSEVQGFKHFSYDIELGAEAYSRIQFALNTHKNIQNFFEVTNLSIVVK